MLELNQTARERARSDELQRDVAAGRAEQTEGAECVWVAETSILDRYS